MSDDAAGTATGNPNEPPVDLVKPAPAEAAAVQVLTDAQILLNRFKGQFDRLMEVHRRLVEVKGLIVAKPGAVVASGDASPAGERPVPFFAGLTMIADADEIVLKAIETDLDDLTRLF